MVKQIKRPTVKTEHASDFHEARQSLLVKALELHYEGILQGLRQLRAGLPDSLAEVPMVSHRLNQASQEPLWVALHQHLPKSPLWRAIKPLLEDSISSEEEFVKVRGRICDEITKLRLRRILPGRCTFCPY